MSYDPLFRSTGEPDYFWCSYWENHSGIPDNELPIAGPGPLPPPLVPGQQGCFRIYDDATTDQIVTAIAVEANGLPLQWAEILREQVPRAMCGTRNLREVVADLSIDIAKLVMRRRELWLRERFVNRCGEVTAGIMTPERFKRLCKERRLKFDRRVGFPDGHEELWVNGSLDSTFTP